MSIAEVRVTEQAGDFDYCRRYNGATYDDYDDEMATKAGTPKAFWADSSDYIYIGADAAFYSFGVRLHTAGSYGAITWEFYHLSNGWTAFTPFHDSTSDFSQNGWLAWGTLTGWNPTLVDGVNAYWIRGKPASITTTAQVYSLLRNVTLSAPLRLNLQDANISKYYRDINGTLQKADIAYTGPTSATIVCRQTALKMDDLNLLRYFNHNRVKLYIEDLAQTATPNPDADAFYKEYEGYIIDCAPGVASPAKMDPNTYEITFAIDAATEIIQ